RHGGKVALVTGGSSGIGQAIVERLAADGARVAIADIADCSETLDKVRAAGGEAFADRCDIADGVQVERFGREIERRFGAVSIVVHAAAYQFVRSFDDVSFDEWRKTQAVNQDAVFHLLKAALPGMKAAGWGRVILIASSQFFIGGQAMAHYVTSKGALIGLAHGLAAELGPHGITINCVAPGLTRTKKAVGDLPEAVFQHVASLQAIPRNGRPEDQSGVVSFVASDDAAFITGQTLLVDGGQGRT
ncbi:SDR family NAD(P)-dependent oxidoreductase, partial [Steroidobacter sp.]|uniref:SDR family NAD(P)-dependent oxidoreductase n=1 Tax=Steroidobacter sp. TaxID=1978227 RepID=UPI001A5D90BF